MTTNPPTQTTLRDQFGRSIEYLRISVTDRCNFRCVYCMPETGMQWLPKTEILSYEEIASVVGQLAPLGLRRLRITGGEPTIRPQIHELIRMLRAVPDITDIALSTNGVRLPEIGTLLRESGLNRVNMRGIPASICREIFSSTTTASSTTNPVATVSAISDRLSRLKPARYMRRRLL